MILRGCTTWYTARRARWYRVRIGIGIRIRIRICINDSVDEVGDSSAGVPPGVLLDELDGVESPAEPEGSSTAATDGGVCVGLFGQIGFSAGPLTTSVDEP